MEALTTQKTWEEIKDSLQLKISNADIHTSISHFLDIPQTDKESLAAYVHRFKWEANRCKFNNDAATIRIVLKGLKNVHIIATKVYKKGPQSLADTIGEDEKLMAAQQITSTLLPTSLVNTMSSDNDKCFQCQETGHMACYCPHIKCFNYKTMDMLLQTALIKYHLQAHQHATEITPPVGMIDPHLGIIATPGIPTVTIGIDTDSVVPNPPHTTPDTGVTSTMTPAGVAPDRFIDLHIVALHATEAQAHIATTTTHPITDPHPAETSPEMTAGPNHTNPTSNITNHHKDLLQVHKQCLGRIRTEGTNRSQLTILPQNTIVQMSRIVTLRMI